MQINVWRAVVFLGLILSLLSCKEEVLPKPKAMLRLDYPAPQYEVVEARCPYTFEKNEIALVVNAKRGKSCEFNLAYPALKATIYISYRAVSNDLIELLRDAQNLTHEHVIKADAIELKAYANAKQKAYGMFYEVSGNAASQSQFYITDSIQHFITGSIYFNAKPNYDSILPGAHYLRNDMQHLMETITWKE